MKCEHCKREIREMPGTRGWWVDANDGSHICQCHEPDQTEAQRDLERLRAALTEKDLWDDDAVLRTIIRLAEKEE